MTRRNLFLRTLGAALAAMLPRKPRPVFAKTTRKLLAFTWDSDGHFKHVELGTTLAAEQITASMRWFTNG